MHYSKVFDYMLCNYIDFDLIMAKIYELYICLFDLGLTAEGNQFV